MRIPQEKIDYIKEHLTIPNNQLAELLHIDKGTVGKYKKQFGYSSIKNFHEYDKYICENYYKKTSKQLAEEIGCSSAYITKVWRLNNLKGKGRFKYYCNNTYFSKIDNEDKAYILGLIASDGCLYKRDGHQGLIQISLKQDDEQILEKILIALDSTHPINHNSNMSTISITSDIMFDDLNKIGLMPQKTWNMDMDKILEAIPFEYQKDFYRGYNDGDGSITSSDKFRTISRTNIKIALPESSAESMIKNLKSHNIFAYFVKDNREDYYQKDFGSLSFNNTTEKYCFLKWIYNTNSSLRFERKKVIADAFIQKVENNETNRSENLQAIEYYNTHFINKS